MAGVGLTPSTAPRVTVFGWPRYQRIGHRSRPPTIRVSFLGHCSHADSAKNADLWQTMPSGRNPPLGATNGSRVRDFTSICSILRHRPPALIDQMPPCSVCQSVLLPGT